MGVCGPSNIPRPYRDIQDLLRSDVWLPYPYQILTCGHLHQSAMPLSCAYCRCLAVLGVCGPVLGEIGRRPEQRILSRCALVCTCKSPSLRRAETELFRDCLYPAY